MPREPLESIGLTPRGRHEYVLADGIPLSLDVTIAEIELKGEVVDGTIVYGDEGAEPLLGVAALQSGGFEVDPRNEELKRLAAVLLTGCTYMLGTQTVWNVFTWVGKLHTLGF